MGIPMSHHAFIYGDNMSVLHKTVNPDSTIKKKCQSIDYHFVREGCAANEWRTAYCTTTFNPSDICTKNLPAGQNRYRKVRSLLYDIYPDKDDVIFN